MGAKCRWGADWNGLIIYLRVERRAVTTTGSRQRNSWVEFDHGVGGTSFSPSPEETTSLYKFQFDVELKSTNTCETSVDYRCFVDKEITFTHFFFSPLLS